MNAIFKVKNTNKSITVNIINVKMIGRHVSSRNPYISRQLAEELAIG